jgi:hypothetical protein
MKRPGKEPRSLAFAAWKTQKSHSATLDLLPLGSALNWLERLRLSVIQSMPAHKQVFGPVLHLCDYPPQKTNPAG